MLIPINNLVVFPRVDNKYFRTVNICGIQAIRFKVKFTPKSITKFIFRTYFLRCNFIPLFSINYNKISLRDVGDTFTIDHECDKDKNYAVNFIDHYTFFVYKRQGTTEANVESSAN